jgi:hypothetical protein
MVPKTAPIFLLGAGFSIPAGYPSHAELTGLVVEKAYEDHTRLPGVPLTGLESPSQLAGLSRGDHFLEAVFLKRVFDYLDKPENFEFFQNALNLFQYPGGMIGFTRMPTEECREWVHLISQQKLCSSSVEFIIQDAIAQIFSEVAKRPADLTYVDRFVEHCEQTKAHVFSTNFDTLLEDACNRKEWIPNVPGTLPYAINGKKRASFSIYKLHGSIDWNLTPFQNPNDDTNYPVVFERCYGGGGIQNIDLNDREKLIRMNLMVAHLHCLRRLYSDAKRLIAIGFSFRDPHASSIIFPPLHLEGYRLTCVTDGRLPASLENLLAFDPIFQRAPEKIQHHPGGAKEFCTGLIRSIG